MSSRLVKRNIDSLSKEITNVEQKLQNVLKTKNRTPVPKRNENTCREVEFFVTGPSGRKLPTAIVKPDSLFRGHESGRKLVDVFKNNDGTVKVTVERKNCDHESHRRSQSTPNILRTSVADNEKSSLSDENMKRVPDRKTAAAPIAGTRKAKTITKSNQSWGQVLDSQHKNRTAVHQQGNETPLSGSVINVQTKKLDNSVHPQVAPTVQRKEVKEAVSKQTSVNVGASVNKSNAVEPLKACKPQHETVSTSTSASSTSYYRSTASETHSTPPGIPHSIHTLENEPFALFNPVTTLNFLVKELRGIVRKNCTPHCVSRVLCDIERTLARIPPDVCEKDSSQGHGDNKVQHVFHAPSPELLEELRRNVEHMEKRSRQLQVTCEALRVDRDLLRQTLTAKQGELDAVLHLLKDREATIEKLQSDFSSVGTKTEEYCKTITELSATIMNLKESKEELVKNQQTLESQLKQAEQQLDRNVTELQLKNMERERILAQLASRERELDVCKQQLLEMKTLIRDQLTSLREAVGGGLPPSEIPPPSLTTSDKPRARLRTSSPTSSADSSQLSVSPSWHRISSITPPPEVNATATRTRIQLTDLHDSQESVTLAGPKAPAGQISPPEFNKSGLIFRSLNQEDSGVGNDVSASKSKDEVRVLSVASEEEVDVVATVANGGPAAYVSKSLREMLEGLQKRSQQLGMSPAGIDFLKSPPQFPVLPPEPGGSSQISAPTDVTDISAAYASLSEPETAIHMHNREQKNKNFVWPE